jgi:hypothetical protein
MSLMPPKQSWEKNCRMILPRLKTNSGMLKSVQLKKMRKNQLKRKPAKGLKSIP